MYGTTLVLVLFSLFSCQRSAVKSDFFYETNRRWIAATKVSWVSKHFEQEDPILKPKGTWQAILKINFLDQDFNEVSDCLFYQVPSEDTVGVLKVIANRSNMPCENIIGENEYAKIDGIINFGYTYNSNLDELVNLVLKVDTHRLKYNFLNLGNNKQAKELLSSSILISKNTGLLISSDINYRVRYGVLKNGDVCFDVDNECNITVEERCNRCQFGFYKTISAACKTQYRKVCGMDECGTQGNPACLRGHLASELDASNYCINDSPLGICQKGLRVTCINGTLFCE